MSVFRLLIFLYIFLIFIACDKSVDPGNEKTQLDISIVADGFGDHNGNASESELGFINEYFSAHQQAWAIGSIAAEYRDESVHAIPADTLVKTFTKSALEGPYNNELDLRLTLNGISFRTPFVGIYVLTRKSQCCIIKFFRAPGPMIGEQEWDELHIL
jgi:hypothetical protein